MAVAHLHQNLTPLIARLSAVTSQIASEITPNKADILSHDEIQQIATNVYPHINLTQLARDYVRILRINKLITSWKDPSADLEKQLTWAVADILDIELLDPATALTDSDVHAIAATVEYLCEYILDHAHLITDGLIQLTAYQHNTTTWALHVDPHTQRGIWCGRKHWIATSSALLDQLHAAKAIRPIANRELYLEAIASFANTAGRNIHASNTTIGKAAIERGARVSEKTAARAVSTIRNALERAGLAIELQRGRHLRTGEIAAAALTHGGIQRRAASVWDLNIPEELRPQPHSPSSPAWATPDAKDRIESERSALRTHINGQAEQPSVSTYSVGQENNSSKSSSRVTHPARKRARKTPKTTIRAKKIADDLLRRASTASGPYARLSFPTTTPPRPGQRYLSRSQAATLISQLVPAHATTMDLLRRILAAQTVETSQGNFAALGWSSQLPTNPAAWFRAVLSRCNWTTPDDELPSITRTQEAFGMSWGGLRRDWSATVSR